MKYLVHIHNVPTIAHPNYPNEQEQEWLLGVGGGVEKDTPFNRHWMATYHGYKRKCDATRVMNKESNKRESFNFGHWFSTYYVLEVEE